MSLLEDTRLKCNDMQYYQILEYLEQGYSIKFAAEQLGVPYSRALKYHENLEFLNQLEEEGEDNESIVNLAIKKSLYLELKSHDIRTIRQLYDSFECPEDFDVDEKLLNKIKLVINNIERR